MMWRDGGRGGSARRGVARLVGESGPMRSRVSRPGSIRSTRYGTLQSVTTEAELIPATAGAVAVTTPGMNAAVKSSGRRTTALITVKHAVARRDPP